MKKFFTIIALGAMTIGMSSFGLAEPPSECEQYAMEAASIEYANHFFTSAWDSLDSYLSYLDYCESNGSVPSLPTVPN
ncbi:MAG: hypothetical protein ACTJF0_05805 [Psychroflexus halocasei]